MQTKLDSNATVFIKLLLDLVSQELISKIELEYVQIAANDVIGKLKLTADVLSNENADDKAELKLIWGSFLADPEIVQALKLALFDAISKVEDEDVKEGLNLLVTPIINTITILTDKDVHDGKQLEKIWLDFIKSKEVLSFIAKHLETILSKVVKNKTILNIVLAVLKLFIKD